MFGQKYPNGHKQNIPEWKKKHIEKKALQEMAKLTKKFKKNCDVFMDHLVTIMETTPDKEAQQFAIYLCTEIITGFEEREVRKFVYDQLGNTLKFYEEEEAKNANKN